MRQRDEAHMSGSPPAGRDRRWPGRRGPGCPVIGAVSAFSALALLLAACGSASGGASRETGASHQSLARAKAELAKYSGAASLPDPGPAFAASKAAGKTVMLASYDPTNPALAAADDAFMEVMRRFGVKVDFCNGNASPTGFNACFQQAISLKMAAIEAQGGSVPTYTTYIKKADAAHIPIFEGADYDPSATALQPGLAGNAGQPWKLIGKLMADWVLVDSKANAHVLYETIPDVDGAEQEEAAFAATLHQECSVCTVTVKGITVADWASDVAPATSSVLLANPKINYVVPGFDPMIAFAGPAVEQAGRQNSVKLLGSGSSFPEMKQLADHQLVYCDVGVDYPALGYEQADQVLRAITSAPQVKEFVSPIKVFTRQNIGSVTVTQSAAAQGAFFSTPSALRADFARAFSGT